METPNNLRKIHLKNREFLGAFTTIELMVTVLILLILSGLAAPSFYSFMQSNQSAAVLSEFNATLLLARNEAVKRGVPIVITANTPSSSGNEWGNGWVIAVDNNYSGTFDEGDSVIKRRSALSNSILLKSAGISNIVFTNRGYLSGASTIEATLCKSGETTSGSKVILLPNGMTDVIENASC